MSTRSTGFDRWVAKLRIEEALRHVEPGSRVCDLGCGVDSLIFEHLRSGGARAGVDYQRPRHRPGVHLVQADLQRGVPWRSGSFDAVTMLAVLEHLTEPEKTLAEAHRVLAPGGRLVLTWPSASVDLILAVVSRIGLVSREMECGHHQPRRPVAEWAALLERIGFRDIRHHTFELGLNHLMVAIRR
jgi:SAM-dependent methyltransferase